MYSERVLDPYNRGRIVILYFQVSIARYTLCRPLLVQNDVLRHGKRKGNFWILVCLIFFLIEKYPENFWVQNTKFDGREQDAYM